MKIYIAILLISAIFFFLIFRPSKPETKELVPISAAPVTIRPTISQQKLFSLIQEWRVKNNFQSYIEDKRLCKIAEDRVDDQPLDDHKGFIKKYYHEPYSLAENLASGWPEDRLLNNWLYSPSHRKALEHAYKYTCLRCTGEYCVQIFSNL